jgi:transcriptional regulator with XRE-family HTH domain
MDQLAIRRVGKLVRDERLRRGITQADVARESGVSEWTIRKLENHAEEKTRLNVPTLTAIARWLDVDPVELEASLSC